MVDSSACMDTHSLLPSPEKTLLQPLPATKMPGMMFGEPVIMSRSLTLSRGVLESSAKVVDIGTRTISAPVHGSTSTSVWDRESTDACDNLGKHGSRRNTKRMTQLLRSRSIRTCTGARSMMSEQDGAALELEILDMISTPSVQTQTPEDGPRLSTVISAIALCSNTVVGAGTLCVPFTMSLTGFILYHVLIVVTFLANYLSLRWLVEVAETLPSDVPRSYEGIAHHYLGGEADLAITTALLFGGFALTMAYMLFITTSLVSALTGFLVQWIPSGCVQNAVMFGVGFGIVLPLLMLKDISKLRYVASFAVCSLFCTAAYVVTSGWTYVQTEGVNQGFVPLRISVDIFDAVPMIVSAYSCHMLVIPIYDALGPGRSPALMGKIMTVALGIAAAIYEVVGLAGYMQFGSDVKGNILASIAMEHSGNVITSVVSFSMAVTLICHVPCVVWPLRSCIISAWHYLVVGFEHSNEEPSDCEWRAASSFIMVGVLALATLLPNVKTALSIVGSIGGAFIVFIYPAAFHLAVVRDLPFGRSWLACSNAPELTMIAIGIVVGIVCLTMSVLNNI